jgi:pimeloyl-ACP methyl ester carboxylesterase
MERLPVSAPSPRLFIAEALELPRLVAAPLLPPVLVERGKGQPVMVLPGFWANDVTTSRLRRSLNTAGYVAEGWGMGFNLGARADMLDHLGLRIARLAERAGQPVSLVGWSLGGVFAREVAKQVPDHVRLVVTLGSPFSGDPRANNAWRLYELVNDHPVDAPPINTVLANKPLVRTIALWSRRDGIIPPDCAAGQPGERDDAVEVSCRHLGFAGSGAGIASIGQVLAAELASD